MTNSSASTPNKPGSNDQAGRVQPSLATTLEPRRANMLAAMGIDVWYTRGVALAAMNVGAESSRSLASNTSNQGQGNGLADQAADVRVGKGHDQGSSAASANAAVARGPKEAQAVIRVQDQPVISAANVSEQENQEQQDEPVESLQFAWIKAGGSLLLIPNVQSSEAQLWLTDVLLSIEWLRRHKRQQVDPQENLTATDDSVNISDAGAVQLSTGEFRWPQLKTSKGDPKKSLALWLQKHCPTDAAWLGVDKRLYGAIAKWSDGVKWQELDDLEQAIRDVEAKKRLWTQIKHSV